MCEGAADFINFVSTFTHKTCNFHHWFYISNTCTYGL